LPARHRTKAVHHYFFCFLDLRFETGEEVLLELELATTADGDLRFELLELELADLTALGVASAGLSGETVGDLPFLAERLGVVDALGEDGGDGSGETGCALSDLPVLELFADGDLGFELLELELADLTALGVASAGLSGETVGDLPFLDERLGVDAFGEDGGDGSRETGCALSDLPALELFSTVSDAWAATTAAAIPASDNAAALPSAVVRSLVVLALCCIHKLHKFSYTAHDLNVLSTALWIPAQ
jgi:hypothetical protein